MFNEKIFNSDRYQYTMSEVFMKTKKDKDKSVFNVFFRKSPHKNNWSIFAGGSEILELINTINNNTFSYDYKINFFSKVMNLSKDDEIVDKLSKLQFTGNIYMMKEGEIVFPNEPMITIEGPLIECQILEVPILSIINHQCLIATKASRIVRASKNISVSSFGSRRAHGPLSSIQGDKAAYIGGCNSVSNILTSYEYDINSSGTMAHSFIESYGSSSESEYNAFKDFVKYNNDGPNILLIDTYNVLKSGLKNAIKVFKEFDLENQNKPYGIRIDSGDLAYLSIRVKKEFIKNNLNNAKIILTNGLDEYLIKDLLEQIEYYIKQDENLKNYKVNDIVNGFGVGDAIACSKGDPCFGGVYKLSEINNTPVMKLSEDTIKIINPGKQQIYRIIQNDEFKADIIVRKKDDKIIKDIIDNKSITITDEQDRRKTTTFDKYKYKILLHLCVQNGDIINYDTNINNARKYFLNNLSQLSPEHKRLINPHIYKVDISNELYDLKKQTIKQIEDSFK